MEHMSDGCKSGYSGGDRFGVHGDSHYCCGKSEAEGKAGNEPKGHVVGAPGKANVAHEKQDGDWGGNDVDQPKIVGGLLGPTGPGVYKPIDAICVAGATGVGVAEGFHDGNATNEFDDCTGHGLVGITVFFS